MDDFILSQSHESIFDLDHDLLNLLLGEFSVIVFSDMTGQIGVFTMLKDQV